MSLTRLVIAFLCVAPLFVAAAWAFRGHHLNRGAILVCLAEALVLTLLAALWFGSIGSGSWPLVFLLLGCLVAGSERGLRSAFLRSGGRAELAGFAADVARYVVAGGLLAWRLG